MSRKYLSDFNSPAPRDVPISIRLKVLFGGVSNQFGWIFFGFGMIFVWIFTFHADLASIFFFRLETKTTVGIVEEINYTNASENDTGVFEVKYTYFDNLGEQHRDVSYITGYPSEDPRVTVEYVAAYPSISRIEGMRRELFGPVATIAIIFPIIGMGFLYSGVRYGLKANRLLSQGRIAFGKLTSSESTGASINNRPVLKLTFNFRAEDGLDYDVTAKTHEPEDLRDEVEEALLYDSNNPSYAVLLDDLPGSTEFDFSGHLVPASLKETIKVLILPVLSICGNGIYLLLTYLGSP